MKIIVDEMPKCPSDCPLSKMKNDDWICGKYNSICNIDMCDLLKPIIDFYVEEKDIILTHKDTEKLLKEKGILNEIQNR